MSVLDVISVVVCTGIVEVRVTVSLMTDVIHSLPVVFAPLGHTKVVAKKVEYSIVVVRVTTLVAIYVVRQEESAASAQTDEVIVEVSVDSTPPLETVAVVDGVVDGVCRFAVVTVPDFISRLSSEMRGLRLTCGNDTIWPRENCCVCNGNHSGLMNCDHGNHIECRCAKSRGNLSGISLGSSGKGN
jgi:hypothetical protein